MPAPPFQAFTVSAVGRRDRIITDVQVCEAFDPISPPSPTPAMQTFKGLWDTGATRTNISPNVVSALKLVASGTTNMQHAGGSEPKPTYMVNIGLPHKVGIAGVLVAEFAGGRQIDILIGMDIIGMGDLAITNVNGNTCMSFLMPSQSKVDYVKEHNSILYSGVGRNDPCPCNSGKKFKKCHGVL